MMKKLAIFVAVDTSEGGEPRFTELHRLAETLGYTIAEKTFIQKRKKFVAATAMGEGKLLEIAEYAFSRKDENPVLVFDNEITSSQQRNIELLTDIPVTDRTGLILEIFREHANTKEAKLQVELARLQYLAPRLRFSRSFDRQAGHMGGKGQGETELELDRRQIRDRMNYIQAELKKIRKHEMQRRDRRRNAFRVVLIGYTNAGKSSIMRKLTNSNVIVEDKLFATLDTTVREMAPETRPRILISDTVGFIKKLPHDLVASFRATLDEARNASLLLQVVDATDKDFIEQIETTQQVLAEIGADEAPCILVFNKIDMLSKGECNRLRLRFPHAFFTSAVQADETEKLHSEIERFFEKELVEREFMVSYADSNSPIYREMEHRFKVLKREYGEDGLFVRLKALPEDIQRLQMLVKPAV